MFLLDSIAVRYKTYRYDCAIFSSSDKDRFTPTKEDIDKAEINLRTKLKELNNPAYNQKTRIQNMLRKYKRQYFGYINEKGEKILYINCFCNKEFCKDWLTKIIFVLDGGSCFWNVKFNLTTVTLFDLNINGYA
jgi:hypothetical protein